MRSARAMRLRLALWGVGQRRQDRDVCLEEGVVVVDWGLLHTEERVSEHGQVGLRRPKAKSTGVSVDENLGRRESLRRLLGHENVHVHKHGPVELLE